VCLLWSIRNPSHELRIGELIDDLCPGVDYTLSHQLNPIIREYRRASSAVIDASLKPALRGHMNNIEGGLRDLGFSGQLLVLSSSGGCLTPSELRSRPIYSLQSGPSVAPIAARSYAELEGIPEDLVVVDAGGTSFDVAVIRDGELKISNEIWLGERWLG